MCAHTQDHVWWLDLWVMCLWEYSRGSLLHIIQVQMAQTPTELRQLCQSLELIDFYQKLTNGSSVLLVRRLCWWINSSWASGRRPPRGWCCGAGRVWSVLTTLPWPSWTDTSKWRMTWAPSLWCCAPPCVSTPTAGYASRRAGKMEKGS